MQVLKGLVLLCLAITAGCATLSEDECLTADWHAIGYEGGAKGERSAQMGSHREACAKYGVTPELREYKKGHEEGLTVFCTGSNGYSRALNGYHYSGVCPGSLEADFLEGYTAGRRIYAAASEVSAIESRQQSNENEQMRIIDQLREKEAALFDATKPEDQRRAIYQRISELKERQGYLTREYYGLIRDQSVAQGRLDALRNQSSYF